MPEFTHIRAMLEGPVPDLLIAEWSEVLSSHVATGFSSSYLSFSRLYPYHGNPLACAVVNAGLPMYREEGHAGFHLPSRIDWGAAIGRGTAHRSAAGRAYLRVPFRHMTPGEPAGGLGSTRLRTMMPQAVYQDALTALRGDKRRREARAAAERLAGAGTRLSRAYALPPFPPALRKRAEIQEGMPGYTWRSRTYEGLVRREQMNPVTGRASGAYFTFRTMVEDSVGWFIPPMPGLHTIPEVVSRTRERITELLGEAARADVVELVRVQIGEAT